METKNIMIVGVGGQGSLLASKLLGHLLMEQGYDVKVSEVHGMSQRGGSVVTYVRYGDKVASPIIDKGEADFIVSFELLEAARVDGASEFRTFWQISLPLLAPGIVTTALFTIVATWNNYFLPLIMLKDSNWYPLTIGLNQWKDQASTAGGQAIQNLVVTGSLITIVPLVIAFLCLQKYWQSGLAAGAVKE